jgi:hypothetical protein
MSAGAQTMSNAERRYINSRVLSLIEEYERLASSYDEESQYYFESLFEKGPESIVFCDMIGSESYLKSIPVSEYIHQLSTYASTVTTVIKDVRKGTMTYVDGKWYIPVTMKKTFEYIDKDGVYRGGCIVPGIEITSQALSTNTAKLPEIEIKYVDKVLTTNTISGMQAGLIHGYIGTVEHIVRKCKQETGKDLKVIATGGLGRIMSENTKEIDIYDPELTFKGLRLVYERNKEKMNGKN